jgi:acetoin utilization protein AcuC
VYYEFDDHPLLYIADIHEDGRFLYPGTGSEWESGRGDASGTKLNIPLNPNSTDQDFITSFKRVEDFIDNKAQPELIILQCGADSLIPILYSKSYNKYYYFICYRITI